MIKKLHTVAFTALIACGSAFAQTGESVTIQNNTDKVVTIQIPMSKNDLTDIKVAPNQSKTVTLSSSVHNDATIHALLGVTDQVKEICQGGSYSPVIGKPFKITTFYENGKKDNFRCTVAAI